MKLVFLLGGTVTVFAALAPWGAVANAAPTCIADAQLNLPEDGTEWLIGQPVTDSSRHSASGDTDGYGNCNLVVEGSSWCTYAQGSYDEAEEGEYHGVQGSYGPYYTFEDPLVKEWTPGSSPGEGDYEVHAKTEATLRTYMGGLLAEATPDEDVHSITILLFGGYIESLDFCCDPDHVCTEPGDLLLLKNPANESPSEGYQAKPGQPSGTTYKWEITAGTDKAHIAGSDTGSGVTLQADAEGDLTLQLTYTYGGANCVYALDTSVQKPNQGYSFWECYRGGWWCPNPAGPPGTMWADLDVVYHVRDAQNRPVPHALWDETWGSGACGLRSEGWDGPTDCDGVAPDHFHLPWNNTYCDARGLLCTQHQTIKVAGWPDSGYFWERDAGLMDGAAPVFPYVWHSGCSNPW